MNPDRKRTVAAQCSPTDGSHIDHDLPPLIAVFRETNGGGLTAQVDSEAPHSDILAAYALVIASLATNVGPDHTEEFVRAVLYVKL